MPVTKLDPYREMAAIKERMNRLFETAMGRTEFGAGGGGVPWTPPADLYESDDEVIVSVELPGVPRAGIEVRVADNTLVLEGQRPPDKGLKDEAFQRVERSTGPFVRRFALPAAVNVERVAAAYELGVLTIRLPKLASARQRQVKVSAGSGA